MGGQFTRNSWRIQLIFPPPPSLFRHGAVENWIEVWSRIKLFCESGRDTVAKHWFCSGCGHTTHTQCNTTWPYKDKTDSVCETWLCGGLVTTLSSVVGGRWLPHTDWETTLQPPVVVIGSYTSYEEKNYSDSLDTLWYSHITTKLDGHKPALWWTIIQI